MGKHNYKVMKITDVADIERAKKGKMYPAGCSLIALSATKGEVDNRYHDKDGEVEPRYAVLVPKIEILPRYMFISIQEAFPEYYSVWRTGINLQSDKLQYLKIMVHDLSTQSEIVRFYSEIVKAEEKEERLIQLAKDMKAHYLDKLFI